MAYKYGLLWLIYGLLYGIVACYFRLLGVPGMSSWRHDLSVYPYKRTPKQIGSYCKQFAEIATYLILPSKYNMAYVFSKEHLHLYSSITPTLFGCLF